MSAANRESSADVRLVTCAKCGRVKEYGHNDCRTHKSPKYQRAIADQKRAYSSSTGAIK